MMGRLLVEGTKVVQIPPREQMSGAAFGFVQMCHPRIWNGWQVALLERSAWKIFGRQHFLAVGS